VSLGRFFRLCCSVCGRLDSLVEHITPRGSVPSRSDGRLLEAFVEGQLDVVSAGMFGHPNIGHTMPFEIYSRRFVSFVKHTNTRGRVLPLSFNRIVAGAGVLEQQLKSGSTQRNVGLCWCLRDRTLATRTGSHCSR